MFYNPEVCEGFDRPRPTKRDGSARTRPSFPDRSAFADAVATAARTTPPGRWPLARPHTAPRLTTSGSWTSAAAAPVAATRPSTSSGGTWARHGVRSWRLWTEYTSRVSCQRNETRQAAGARDNCATVLRMQQPQLRGNHEYADGQSRSIPSRCGVFQ